MRPVGAGLARRVGAIGVVGVVTAAILASWSGAGSPARADTVVVPVATGLTAASGLIVFGADDVGVTDPATAEVVLLDHDQDRQPYGNFPSAGSAVLANPSTFYVAYGPGRIARFRDTGWWGPLWTPSRTFATGFASIGDLAVGPKGRLYVADPASGIVWSTNGWSRSRVVEGIAAPTGLAVADDGTLFVGDTAGRRIWRISPDGERTALGPRGVLDPVGMSWTSREGLVVASRATGQIVSISSSGVARVLAQGVSRPGDVSVVGGQVYFTSTGSTGVSRVRFSLIGAPILLSAPNEPLHVRPGYTTATTAEVRWDPPTSSGLPVTHYLVSLSRDEGATWQELTVPAWREQAQIPDIGGPARAVLVRVAAVNDRGQGPWSQAELVTTKGARLMRVAVVDADGKAVIGGAITWRMTDLPVSSSATYGLTDAGLIDFPLAPAGRVEVTIRDARTMSGALVSGTFESVLGYDRTELVLPDAPVTTKSVRVAIPIEDGFIPIPRAQVTVNDTVGQFTDVDCRDWAFGHQGLSDICIDYGPASIRSPISYEQKVEGFTFHISEPEWPLLTDDEGVATIRAFMTGDPQVRARYDDGVVDQGVDLVLRAPTTRAELDYLPWLDVADGTITADVGEPVEMTVQVKAPFSSALTRGRLISPAGVSGIPVSVIRPDGTPAGRCDSRLSARTDARGRATLVVCATASGEYRFAPAGAAAVASVMLRVRGSAPLPPATVDASSRAPGALTVTWNPPGFDGGAPVTGYTVTVKRNAGRLVTRRVDPSTRSVTIRGLAHATDYAVTVTAATRNGVSRPVQLTAPVA